MARRHSRLGATESLDASAGPFSVQITDAVRPYRVLNASQLQPSLRDRHRGQQPLPSVVAGGTPAAFLHVVLSAHRCFPQSSSHLAILITIREATASGKDKM